MIDLIIGSAFCAARILTAVVLAALQPVRRHGAVQELMPRAPQSWFALGSRDLTLIESMPSPARKRAISA
jgi:hypothetical protein